MGVFSALTKILKKRKVSSFILEFFHPRMGKPSTWARTSTHCLYDTKHLYWFIVNINFQIYKLFALGMANVPRCIPNPGFQDENSVLNLIYPYPMVVYDAPENITRMGAGDKAFTWSIGCILSEMITEPAYLDTMSTDPFQVLNTTGAKTTPLSPNQPGNTHFRNLWLSLTKLTTAFVAPFIFCDTLTQLALCK